MCVQEVGGESLHEIGNKSEQIMRQRKTQLKHKSAPVMLWLELFYLYGKHDMGGIGGMQKYGGIDVL